MTETDKKKLFVSVIMPVRNEADFIRQSLAAVLEQDFPHEQMEIIVADGMSTDETREKIAQLKSVTSIHIKIVDNPEQIAPTGLNYAIAASKGDIIIRVDGHCEIDNDYVTNCVKYLQAGKAEGVGGPIETVGETLKARAIAAAMSSKFGVGGSAFRCINDREMYVDTVAFPGYTRKVLEMAGRFNSELVRNQDDEFNYRIRKLGGRILLAPDIRSRYYSRSTFRSLWRQYFQYGTWKVRVLQLHPKQMSLRQFVPFAFVMTNAFLIAASSFSNLARWGLAILITTYLLACILAAFRSIKEIGLAGVPLLFISFPILHFSYGTGFLYGLFVFRTRWKTVQATDEPAVS
ncbi:MAG: glycosyltransferase family 2 protein [Blastocatellia bacterium]